MTFQSDLCFYKVIRNRRGSIYGLAFDFYGVSFYHLRLGLVKNPGLGELFYNDQERNSLSSNSELCSLRHYNNLTLFFINFCID